MVILKLTFGLFDLLRMNIDRIDNNPIFRIYDFKIWSLSIIEHKLCDSTELILYERCTDEKKRNHKHGKINGPRFIGV